MAQKVNITLTDDIDGTLATETVSFALDGTSYEVDLNAKNATALRKAFEKYVAAGRKVGRGNVTSIRVRGRKSGSGVDASAVRAWASSNKVKISPRGRIPAAVVEQYRAAGN